MLRVSPTDNGMPVMKSTLTWPLMGSQSSCQSTKKLASWWEAIATIAWPGWTRWDPQAELATKAFLPPLELGLLSSSPPYYTTAWHNMMNSIKKGTIVSTKWSFSSLISLTNIGHRESGIAFKLCTLLMKRVRKRNMSTFIKILFCPRRRSIIRSLGLGPMPLLLWLSHPKF